MMDNFNNFICDYILFPTIFVIIVVIGFYINDKSHIKEELYNECLTSKYDKFQCYAMIYGDK